MASSEYSKWVLEGLEVKGILAQDIARITGLPIAKLKKIRQGKASLSFQQTQAIEGELGMSSGQIALLAIPDADDDFVAVINSLAGCRSEKPSLARH